MNIWVIKNIKFGHRYTTNKTIRKTIRDYFDNYLLDLLSKKGSENDKFVIAGGVFSNTNPSLIAISDAKEYIKKISDIMEVYLVPNSKDIRLFDGNDYSTLELFRGISNVVIENRKNVIVGECVIDTDKNEINMNGTIINIPNAIQFDEKDEKSGIFISRGDKFTSVGNKYSPKHITYTIDSFEDFEKIEKGKDIIHLIIDEKLVEINKNLLDLSVFKLNPSSIKFKGEKKITNTKTIKEFNIKKTIYDTIGDDSDLRKQFDRILGISLKKY